MNLEYLISVLITVALLVYLTYALLKPEKFLRRRRCDSRGAVRSKEQQSIGSHVEHSEV